MSGLFDSELFSTGRLGVCKRRVDNTFDTLPKRAYHRDAGAATGNGGAAAFTGEDAAALPGADPSSSRGKTLAATTTVETKSTTPTIIATCSLIHAGFPSGSRRGIRANSGKGQLVNNDEKMVA